MLTVRVWNENYPADDDLIGEARVDLSTLAESELGSQQTLQLQLRLPDQPSRIGGEGSHEGDEHREGGHSQGHGDDASVASLDGKGLRGMISLRLTLMGPCEAAEEAAKPPPPPPPFDWDLHITRLRGVDMPETEDPASVARGDFQDPYVAVTLGDQTSKTTVKDGAGTTAPWPGETLCIPCYTKHVEVGL